MEESSQEQNMTSLVRRSLQLLILFSILYGVPIPSKSQFFTEFFWLLSRALERKYMFLLCNGILAFLAKKSSSSSGSDISQLPGVVDAIAEDVDEFTSPSFEALEDDILLVDEDNEEVKREERSLLEPPPKKLEEKEEETTYVKGLEGEVSIKKDDVKQGEKEEERAFTVKQEGDEYGGEAPSMEANEESVSTEELNRKFEEFIRKMKEEIRIEAQQQLIAV
ncbi:hypothetical protein K2173_017991 [Erythroxylum novogranatense]|uniref:Uncharacterized protein n=1 Tax=Erythroxylum novogranatense TaxID=1862640 RepID=A0AAV8TU76_9ROSI|nr:hypothetical protein K2173_017991 [Erythroxylum novogranatense]